MKSQLPGAMFLRNPGLRNTARWDQENTEWTYPLAPAELRDLGGTIAKFKIYGDRYTAEEQRRVEK